MYLIFLDTETTGLNPEKHRLLEIAFKVVDARTAKGILSYETIIAQPMEVWAEADPASLKVNGFSFEQALQGKSEKVAASEISSDLNHLFKNGRGGVFVCQNPSFDRAFFNQLINPDIQVHYRWPYHWLDLASMYWATRLLDDRSAALAMDEKDLSKNRIAEHYGIQTEKVPHRAMNGVDHLIACYNALFD